MSEAVMGEKQGMDISAHACFTLPLSIMLHPAWAGTSPGTFGDDTSVRQLDVLGAAPRHSNDGRVQAQTLLDTHGGEGHLR